MKKMLLAMFALAALSLLAPNTGVAQTWGEGYLNQIGIFTTRTPTPATVQTDAVYSGAPGSGIAAYVVCLNPYNTNLDRPINTVGGFEFRIVAPANVFILGATFPPNTNNFANSPDFLCGSNAPVTNDQVTLITLTLGEFGGVPSLIYLSPVQEAPQSVPNNIAITDFNDDFSISVAHPASGDFANPVFGLYTPVVPSEDATWGGVKSLYR